MLIVCIDFDIGASCILGERLRRALQREAVERVNPREKEKVSQRREKRKGRKTPDGPREEMRERLEWYSRNVM